MRLEFALVATILLAVLALRFRAVTAPGALAGVTLAGIFALAPSPAPFLVFLLFVAVGSFSSRLGASRKRTLGVMQPDSGRRDWTHALANCAPAAAVLVLWRLAGAPPGRTAEIAACTGLAAMLSDTVASEWGMWLGGPPRHVLTWKRVPVGTDGAVTVVGLVISLLTAVAAGLLAAPFLSGGAAAFSVIAIGGFAGNLADSFYGATFEPRLGRHGGSLVNALASATAIVCALLAA